MAATHIADSAFTNGSDSAEIDKTTRFFLTNTLLHLNTVISAMEGTVPRSGFLSQASLKLMDEVSMGAVKLVKIGIAWAKSTS